MDIYNKIQKDKKVLNKHLMKLNKKRYSNLEIVFPTLSGVITPLLIFGIIAKIPLIQLSSGFESAVLILTTSIGIVVSSSNIYENSKISKRISDIKASISLLDDLSKNNSNNLAHETIKSNNKNIENNYSNHLNINKVQKPKIKIKKYIKKNSAR